MLDTQSASVSVQATGAGGASGRGVASRPAAAGESSFDSVFRETVARGRPSRSADRRLESQRESGPQKPTDAQPAQRRPRSRQDESVDPAEAGAREGVVPDDAAAPDPVLQDPAASKGAESSEPSAAKVESGRAGDAAAAASQPAASGTASEPSAAAASEGFAAAPASLPSDASSFGGLTPSTQAAPGTSTAQAAAASAASTVSMTGQAQGQQSVVGVNPQPSGRARGADAANASAGQSNADARQGAQGLADLSAVAPQTGGEPRNGAVVALSPAMASLQTGTSRAAGPMTAGSPLDVLKEFGPLQALQGEAAQTLKPAEAGTDGDPTAGQRAASTPADPTGLLHRMDASPAMTAGQAGGAAQPTTLTGAGATAADRLPAAASQMPHAQASPNMDRLANVVHAAVGRQQSVARMQLQPPELGAVTAVLHLRQNKMELKLEVASQAARDLVSGGLDRLREALQQQGITLDRTTVNVAPRSEQATGDAQQQAWQGTADPHAGSSQPDSGRQEGGHDAAGTPGLERELVGAVAEADASPIAWSYAAGLNVLA